MLKTNQKLCSRCHTEPQTTRGYCKPCHNAYKRERYATSQKAKNQVRVDAWKRQGLNLTWTEYQQLHDQQDGLCAICHQTSNDGRALHVDHNHTTGQVRAPLCMNCNTAIGSAQENPDLLHAMADYLQTHQFKHRSYF